MLPRIGRVACLSLLTLLAAGVAQADHDPPAPSTRESPSSPLASLRDVQALARALPAQATHLLEDMEIDLRRQPNFEHLMDDARKMAESAEHLAASVDQGVDLNHITRDFQEFDEAWHHLTGQLRQLGRAARHVDLAAGRVARLDAQLHRALRLPAPVDSQSVQRLAETLATAAEHLQNDVETDLDGWARFAGIVQAADQFADSAEHLRARVAGGADSEHARTDFAEVDAAWQKLADRLYSPSLRRFDHLHQAASRVAPLVGELSDALGVLRDPVPPRRPTSGSVRTRFGYLPLEHDDFDLPRECWRWAPRTAIPLDDEWPVETFLDDDFPVRRDRRDPLGELRSLQDDGGRSRLPGPEPSLPTRQPRGVTPPPAPRRRDPRIGPPAEEFDGHNHNHGDGHDHSRPLPSPTPKKPAPTPAPSTKQAAPRPAEPKLDPAVRESLAKLSPEDRAAAIAQRVCPVTGDLLGEMGTPIKLHVQGRDVFVCCHGCVKKVQANPGKYLGDAK